MIERQKGKILNKAIKDFLQLHAQQEPVSFHMPGHKGARIYRENGYGAFLEQIMDCDITEIPGADNLFQTEGIIAETMAKYRALYEVEQSYLLINGSSGGLIAAILTAVSKGGKLVMARNCHKSIFNALQLGDITPIYAYPETLEAYGVLGGISADEIARCLDENPEAEAVILPSPNYCGICSDIRAIAKVTHDRGKVLIVDQAHGAHLKFFDKYGIDGFPRAAEDLGADLVINSIHKTLASWTQSALLNVCTDRVNCHVLEDKLQMIESSSPSYPLMATLDINADLLLEKGEDLTRAWAESLTWFYEEVKKIPGLVIMETQTLDHTKLNIDLSAYGVNGNELENLLMEQGIFLELVTGNIIMCMSGIGNTRSDFERLLTALREITAARKPVTAAKMAQPPALTTRLERRALPREKVLVPLAEAAGKVCASSLIPYPPGVPIACPGEVLTEEVLAYVKARRDADEKVIGITADGDVFVGK